MAHNLRTNANGDTALLYSGATPWHGLGTACPDSFHAHEALKAFPFTYSGEAIHRPNGDVIPDKKSIVISDTNDIVGIVGDGYEIVQPADALDFMDSISEQGRLRYKTVGALGKGEKIWLLAHVPDNIFEAVKGDPIEEFLLLSTSYDGSSATDVRGTSIRVVCANTLAQATSGAKPFISIRHTKNAGSRLRMAAEIMQSYERQNKTFREAMIYLAKHPINDQLVHDFEVEMFGDINQVEQGRGRTILQNKLAKFAELLIVGKGTEVRGVVGTAYGMVNAYTEWADWFSTVKGTTDRTNAIVFGNASKEKTRALETALELVGV